MGVAMVRFVSFTKAALSFLNVNTAPNLYYLALHALIAYAEERTDFAKSSRHAQTFDMWYITLKLSRLGLVVTL